MDRRETLKWVLSASAVIPLGRIDVLQAGETPSDRSVPPQPYGTDPDLRRIYHPGELWPLTLSQLQRSQATLLCDTIMPADGTSPSASAVGVVDFIDEWISAPYPIQRRDRDVVLRGLTWLDSEANRRCSRPLLAITPQQLHGICDAICWLPKTQPQWLEGARFFARYRDLTTGGFYTTPQGRADLQYIGNTPLPRFEGPPPEVLKKAGLI
jgi:Gluconate 2-dehydrogenase subunit 3